MKTNVLLFFILMYIMLAGCSNPDQHSILIGKVTRTYIVHTPPSYSNLYPKPLIIALHQFLDTGKGMQEMTGLNAVADKEGFFVAYPNGLQHRWNAAAAPGDTDDVSFIEHLIDTMAQEYPIDLSRVYVTGASNGSMMAQTLACKLPEKIAAVAAVFGTGVRNMAETCYCTIPVPVCIIHGSKDPIIPWGGVQQTHPGQPALLSVPETVDFWVHHNNCSTTGTTVELPDTAPTDGTHVSKTTYATNVGEVRVEFYTIQEGGHTWPGSPHNWPSFIVGKTSMDINASEVIWSFFKPYTRSVSHTD